MSYDLAIWKWKDTPSDPIAVYSAIMEDRPPKSLTRFNVAAVEEALYSELGLGGDESPIIVNAIDFTGARRNWILLDCSYTATGMIPRIIATARRAGAVVFDPQTTSLDGEAWSPPQPAIPGDWNCVLKPPDAAPVYDPAANVIMRILKSRRCHSGVVLFERADSSYLQLGGHGVASFVEHYDAVTGELRRAYSDHPSFRTSDGTTIAVCGQQVSVRKDEWFDRVAVVDCFVALAAGQPFPLEMRWRVIGKLRNGRVEMFES